MEPMAACLLAVTVAALNLTEAELRAVTAGEVPTRIEAFTNERGKAAGRGWGAIVIERPLAEVWATLLRFEERPQYVPRLQSATVLERQRDRARVRQEVDATVTTSRYTLWFHLDEIEHIIGWTLDKTADNTVTDADGDYRLAELAPARTLLAYRAYVDTGLRIPQSIQTYMQKRSIPDLLRAIKRRVESGGTWKKR
jgi:hypothetical protein